jgi:hypothetical protein
MLATALQHKAPADRNTIDIERYQLLTPLLASIKEH